MFPFLLGGIGLEGRLGAESALNGWLIWISSVDLERLIDSEKVGQLILEYQMD